MRADRTTTVDLLTVACKPFGCMLLATVSTPCVCRALLGSTLFFLNPAEPSSWIRCGRRRDGVDIELPYLSKFLLLAAYVASRNPPCSDRPLFDPTVGKRRRHGHLAHDKQVR